MIKTIADLDINWIFGLYNSAYNNIEVAKKTKQYINFCNMNPEIHGLIIKPNRDYHFSYFNRIFKCGSYDSETLGEYFVHLDFAFWIKFKTTIKLSKFERVSDMKYIIHVE